MAKCPMGFPNMNFVQGQVTGGTPGAPVATQQLQNQQMSHTGKNYNIREIQMTLQKDNCMIGGN